MKYPKQGSLTRYFDETVVDEIHNALKRGQEIDMKKYQVFLKPLRKKSNKHKTGIYK